MTLIVHSIKSPIGRGTGLEKSFYQVGLSTFVIMMRELFMTGMKVHPQAQIKTCA